MQTDYVRFAGRRAVYRTDTVRPQAKIVVQADTHEQLDSVLLALSRAVAAHQQTKHEHVSHR